jgi:histidinol-phosphatase (PHP family)
MTQPTPILYDSHMHTPLCKHARGEPEEYAATAEKRNLKGVIITCHNPGPTPDFSARFRMSMNQFDDYVALVERTRQAWGDRVDVRLGLECDYMPGLEPFLDNLLNRAEFHHVLGSLHPMLDYYKAAYLNGDDFAFQQLYFEHLAQSAETGLFDTLSHPDLVKNMFPRTWRIEPLLDDIRRSLDRIAKTGVAMELNTSGLQKSIREMNPNPTMLAEMQQRGIPVVLGSDSHDPFRVAANFEDALDLLEDAGYTHVSFFLNRERQEVSIENGRSSLTKN